jgi:AcrR family transcriptional regulator
MDGWFSEGAMMRDRIMDKAAMLFARYGFKKTSMAEIAREVGLGKATLYEYFKSKEELFATIINKEAGRSIDIIEQKVKEQKTPQDKLRAFFHERIARLEEMAKVYEVSDERFLEFLPLAKKALKDCEERELMLLCSILEEGLRQKVFYLASPVDVAVALLSAVRGMDFLFLRMDGALDMKKASLETLEILIRGLMTPLGNLSRS